MFFKRSHRSPAAPRQRGSVMITAAIAMSLLLVTLTGTELGYLFFLKREFQKTADLAALAGAQQIRSSCAAAKSAALTNANGSGAADVNRNMPGGFSLTSADADVSCVKWSRDGSTVPAGAPIANAVKVTITRTPAAVLPFAVFSRTISVKATAALLDPYAVFSVGTKLVIVSGDSTLGRSLKGIGLDPGTTSLVGYDGLANVKITPGGLLAALGIPVASDITVGGLNTLLAANKVELGTLLNAIVTAGGQQALASSNITLVNAITSQLKVTGLTAALGSTASPATGLFAQIVAPDASAKSALNIGVGALDLISAAIGVAASNHAVDIPQAKLTIPSLLSVTAQTALIEPPSIAMGGVGSKAYTAQLRTYLKVKTITSGVPVVGGLVNLNLPIMIDAVSGSGTLAEMCTPALRDATGKDRARITVDASVLKVCIGTPGTSPANETSVFSTSSSCESGLQPTSILSTKLAGINLLSVNTKLTVDALPATGSVTLAESETGTVGNDFLAGTTIRSLTDGLLAALLNANLNQSPAMTTAQATQMATDLWGTPPCTTADCRKTRLAAANTKVNSSSTLLGGLVGTLTADALNVLGQLNSDMNNGNLLTGVGSLVTGLLTSVGNVLGDVLGGLLGNACTGGLGFGSGQDSECIKDLANGLKNSSTENGKTITNAVTALTGFLLQSLQPVLNNIGSMVLTPILKNTLGLNLGQVDVHLQTLQCEALPTLVD